MIDVNLATMFVGLLVYCAPAEKLKPWPIYTWIMRTAGLGLALISLANIIVSKSQ